MGWFNHQLGWDWSSTELPACSSGSESKPFLIFSDGLLFHVVSKFFNERISKKGTAPSLKLTQPLKIDGWKMNSKSPFGMAKFQGARSQFLFTFPSFQIWITTCMFPKKVGFPLNHPFSIGCSILFTIHFGGPPLFFGKHPHLPLQLSRASPFF